MQSIYKCKECNYGPCYCQTAWRPEENMYGDDENLDRPLHCPYFGDQEQSDFNLVNPEIRMNTKFSAAMEEWLCSVGYDDAPEDLRDAILGCGMDPRGIDAGKALKALRMIEEYDEGYLWGTEMEEWKRSFDKIKKIDLLNAIFPIAFKAGIIYGEMLRQKREMAEK